MLLYFHFSDIYFSILFGETIESICVKKGSDITPHQNAMVVSRVKTLTLKTLCRRQWLYF